MYFKRIGQLRNELKKSQREISKILKVNQSNYSRWETGKETIPFFKLYDLCNYYNINIDYIVGITNKKINVYNKAPINKNFISKNIKFVRKSNNISQVELAKLLRTTQSTISAFENGKVLILTAFINKMAKKFKFSIDEICNRI